MEWNGERRKLVLHANHNGFLYAPDREDGELLLAEPFVNKLTWAEPSEPTGGPCWCPASARRRPGT